MAQEPNLARRMEERVAHRIDEATPDYVQGHHPPSEQERRQRQQAESQQAFAGPGTPALSPAQAFGLGMGLVIGGIVGAVVFLPMGFIPLGDLAVGWRLLVAAVIGAFAGGTAGAVYWGGRAPELSGEMVDDDGVNRQP